MKTMINKSNVSRSDRIFEIVVYIIMIAFLIVILYPLIFVVSSSFSSGTAVTSGRVILWPVDFSLDGYQVVFNTKSVGRGFVNSVIYTVGGTIISLFLTILVAYPLSKRSLQFKRFYMALFMIPMFFTGGLVPTYLIMSSLHLTNTRWAVILCGALSIYNMLVMRTFFQNSIPYELYEAAKIDGISDIGYLVKIVLPLSKAIIAVISLYYAVAYWNSYFNAMIYIRDLDKQPLQLLLKDIMSAAKISANNMDGDMAAMAQRMSIVDSMKYAMVVVTTAPILVSYPIVQKYFKKGVMLGSVKG